MPRSLEDFDRPGGHHVVADEDRVELGRPLEELPVMRWTPLSRQ